MAHSDRLYKQVQVLAHVCLLALALAMPGCRSGAEGRVIKLAHGLDPTHPVHRAMVFMARRVAEKSKGRLRIDIYPSEQLGSERECLELLQIGSLGMTKVSCSVLEGFVPSVSVLSLPYLFRDEDHLFAVLEGGVGKKLLLEGEKYWLRGLCFYNAGSRSFYTKIKPILEPADLAGLKIRTQQSPTSVRMLQLLGGSPAPIAWGELYSALQQGVVDGAENNPPSFHLSRHYEVCKHYSLDEHTSVPDILLISTRIWADLSPEFQKIIQQAADESVEVQKQLWRDATEAAIQAVEEAGVRIYRPDKTAFTEKVAPIYEEIKKKPGIDRLVQEIRAVR
jgi:tripartite ATP-independent transporter DctP family solute receptor